MRNLILLLVFAAGGAWAKELHKGFVQIRPDQSLYVEHRPARNGRPTLFLLNGLTYTTREWESFISALDRYDPSLGIVRYDMEGQIQTKTAFEKGPVLDPIPIENQVRDLKDLVETLDIKGPKSLAGLSYGGAVALYYSSLYAQDFDHFIPMAPFLEALPEQDRLIRYWIWLHRNTHPFDRRSDDELYSYYLRNLVYSTYYLAEPIILEHPFKLEGIFRMVEGARRWFAFDFGPIFPEGKIHLIAARNDEHVKFNRIELLWEKVNPMARASFLILEESRHKLTEEHPDFVAKWLLNIINNESFTKEGRTFIGRPSRGEAESTSGAASTSLAGQSLKVHLYKAGFCEALLRKITYR